MNRSLKSGRNITSFCSICVNMSATNSTSTPPTRCSTHRAMKETVNSSPTLAPMLLTATLHSASYQVSKKPSTKSKKRFFALNKVLMASAKSQVKRSVKSASQPCPLLATQSKAKLNSKKTNAVRSSALQVDFSLTVPMHQRSRRTMTINRTAHVPLILTSI